MKFHVPLMPLCLLSLMPAALSAEASGNSTPPAAAAPAADAESIYQSAAGHLKGEGVEKDERKGFELMTAAAQQGHPKAAAILGYLYSAGLGTAKDYGQAVKWFRVAAGKNDAVSQVNVARLLVSEDKLPMPEDTDEAAQRWVEAVKWFRMAADQGFREGQSSYGLTLLRGDYGVAADPAAAARYLIPAAGAGDLEAMNALGNMYQLGNGVPRDAGAAEGWFRKAAMAGNVKAQSSLGLFLDSSATDASTRAEALAWLLLAADAKDPVASKVVDVRVPVMKPDDLAAGRKKMAEIRRAIRSGKDTQNP